MLNFDNLAFRLDVANVMGRGDRQMSTYAAT